jgi:hypothetical protein
VDVINELLRDHVSALPVWDHKQKVAQLHDWVGRFNTEFELGIDTPALQIAKLRVETASRYKQTRNGLGLANEITLSQNCLDDPLAVRLAALFRELLREWQQLHGQPSRGSHYYNQQFQAKAAGYGLFFNPKGHLTEVVPGPFTELLRGHGVDDRPLLELSERVRCRGQSKMLKWTCACGMNLRAARRLQAKCMVCRQMFVRME